MSDWQHKLELKDLHNKYRAGELTPEALGKEVSKRLTALIERNRPPISEDLLSEAEDIASEFENGIEEVDDYDNVLARLYDWADTSLDGKFGGKKLCWINTF